MTDPNYGFVGITPIYTIEDNVQRALAFQRTHTSEEVIDWFFNTVKNNKDGHLPEELSMDYKQINPIFQNFGNYNYGVVGKALGFSDWVLEHAAGYAQGKSDGLTEYEAIQRSLFEGIGKDNQVTVNGDNAGDQLMITQGIIAAKAHGFSDSDLGIYNTIKFKLENTPIKPSKYLIPSSLTKAISDFLGTLPDPQLKVIKYVPYSDPLVLDLDGDGLEITPLSKAILFDTNGDTIKAGTAWAGADDGLVVWDRNGNGLIDSGRELFGDEMMLADGNKAAHGFAALKDLDTGSVINGRTVGANDNVFDANDSAYANLRIWNDLNQDGISQANELTTLSDAGVQSINLVSTSTQTKYTDALLIEDGSFTRTGGSTGQAGSFILAQNYFARAFSPIAVSDAAKALPDFKACPERSRRGTGWVRDLQGAMNDAVWRMVA